MRENTERTNTLTAIRIERLSKRFETAAVIHDLTLDVKAGELLALLGPSGSGKTTLLRLVAGLEHPDGGRVIFGDRDATALPVQRRAVGFVFQHYALFRHMTVADNIAYGLRARRRAERPAKTDIDRRVAELLDLIRLSGFGSRYPSQLSGGQRQRVALARALAIEPRVLLLDEPFGALDAQVRKDLRHWLREVHDRTGQTTIFVTHDQEEALELADRVAILNEGRLEQAGTPDEVQDGPLSPVVVRFLGDASTLDGVACDGTVFIADRATPVVPPQGVSGPVTLHARPWHLAITEAGAGHIDAIVRSSYRSQGRQRVEAVAENGVLLMIDGADGARPDPGLRIGIEVRGGFVFAKPPATSR